MALFLSCQLSWGLLTTTQAQVRCPIFKSRISCWPLIVLCLRKNNCIWNIISLKGESGENAWSSLLLLLALMHPQRGFSRFKTKKHLPEMERTWRDISIHWLWERPLHKTCLLLINLWNGQILGSPSSTSASRKLTLSLRRLQLRPVISPDALNFHWLIKLW